MRNQIKNIIHLASLSSVFLLIIGIMVGTPLEGLIGCAVSVFIVVLCLLVETDFLTVNLLFGGNNHEFNLDEILSYQIKAWALCVGMCGSAGLTIIVSVACWYYMITGIPVTFTFNVVNEGWVECFLFPVWAYFTIIGAYKFTEQKLNEARSLSVNR